MIDFKTYLVFLLVLSSCMIVPLFIAMGGGFIQALFAAAIFILFLGAFFFVSNWVEKWKEQFIEWVQEMRVKHLETREAKAARRAAQEDPRNSEDK